MSTSYQAENSDSSLLNSAQSEYTAIEFEATTLSCFVKLTALFYDPREEANLTAQLHNLSTDLQNMYKSIGDILREHDQKISIVTFKPFAEDATSVPNICIEQPFRSDDYPSSTPLDCNSYKEESIQPCTPASTPTFVEDTTSEQAFLWEGTIVNEHMELSTLWKDFSQASQELAINDPYWDRYQSYSNSPDYFDNSSSGASMLPHGDNTESTLQESVNTLVNEEAGTYPSISENEDVSTSFGSRDEYTYGHIPRDSDDEDAYASDAMNVDDAEGSLWSTEDEEPEANSPEPTPSNNEGYTPRPTGMIPYYRTYNDS